jgi:hypothetical protein
MPVLKKKDVYIKEWLENQEKRPHVTLKHELKDVTMPQLKRIGFKNGLN